MLQIERRFERFRMTRRSRMAAMLLAVAFAVGCGAVAEWRIAGEWESETLPKRTLQLERDGSYRQRFSGRTLGFVSELLGPETGRWRIERGALVLTRTEPGGAETTRRLPLDQLGRREVTLAGERWWRLR